MKILEYMWRYIAQYALTWDTDANLAFISQLVGGNSVTYMCSVRSWMLWFYHTTLRN